MKDILALIGFLVLFVVVGVPVMAGVYLVTHAAAEAWDSWRVRRWNVRWERKRARQRNAV